MLLTELEVDSLIETVRADLDTAHVTDDFWDKLRDHQVTESQVRAALSKRSFIVRYYHRGETTAFFDPISLVLVAWKSESPTRLKTAFFEFRGVRALESFDDFEYQWHPR